MHGKIVSVLCAGACPNDKTKVTRVRRLYDIANILQVMLSTKLLLMQIRILLSEQKIRKGV